MSSFLLCICLDDHRQWHTHSTSYIRYYLFLVLQHPSHSMICFMHMGTFNHFFHQFNLFYFQYNHSPRLLSSAFIFVIASALFRNDGANNFCEISQNSEKLIRYSKGQRLDRWDKSDNKTSLIFVSSRWNRQDFVPEFILVWM